MSSVVQICNRALTTYLGNEPITDITEETPAAVQCNLHYDATRKALLESEWWYWASKIDALAELSNDREEWAFKYAMPGDALDIRWVNDPAVAKREQNIQQTPDIQREIMDGAIYCDLQYAYCYYTIDVTNPTKMPQYFQDALSAQLAVAIAMPLSEDIKKVQNAREMAQDAYDRALALDARRAPPLKWDVSPEYMQARGIY